MVTGGWRQTDTTEIFRDDKWTVIANKLPIPLETTIVKTIYGRILMFGILLPRFF